MRFGDGSCGNGSCSCCCCSQGRTGTVRIDDHGRPFRTSGIKGLPRYWYGSDNGERQWVPATD